MVLGRIFSCLSFSPVVSIVHYLSGVEMIFRSGDRVEFRNDVVFKDPNFRQFFEGKILVVIMSKGQDTWIVIADCPETVYIVRTEWLQAQEAGK